MKVWILEEEWILECDDGRSITVYDSHEKAVNDLKDRIKDARIDMNYKESDEEEDIIEEQEDDYYSIYEDGFYRQSHITIRIMESEVK